MPNNSIMSSFVYPPIYSEVNGYLLGSHYNDVKHLIDNFEVRDSDVWVTTAPRSGTTWTQEMVWLIVNNFNFQCANSSLHDRSPYLELQTLCDWKTFMKTIGEELTESIFDSINYAANDKSMHRCMKTHLAWELLPSDIRNGKKRPKIIHVIRNPKDVCVSFYHHHRVQHGYTGNFNEFKNLFLQNKLIYSPYWGVVNSYLKRRDDANVLIITYEDMKRDLNAVIKQVAKFLNKTASNDQMDKLLDHISFKSMQNNTHLNVKSLFKDASDEPGPQFIRKGVVGDHKTLMTPEIIAEFDKWIAENNIYNLAF